MKKSDNLKYYVVFGVGKGVLLDEFKKVYRKVVIKNYFDKGGDLEKVGLCFIWFWVGFEF